MKYLELQEGRSFLLRFEHKENLLTELRAFFKQNNLQGALFWIMGAFKKGTLVGGPAENSFPPVPLYMSFEDTREILGWGNISLLKDGSSKIHLHMSAGRRQETFTGCLRKEGEVYLTCEVYLKEIMNFPYRKKDSSSGIELLDIPEKKNS